MWHPLKPCLTVATVEDIFTATVPEPYRVIHRRFYKYPAAFTFTKCCHSCFLHHSSVARTTSLATAIRRQPMNVWCESVTVTYTFEFQLSYLAVESVDSGKPFCWKPRHCHYFW
jgi:hypothetical protein